jgi:hypothetical protein
MHTPSHMPSSPLTQSHAHTFSHAVLTSHPITCRPHLSPNHMSSSPLTQSHVVLTSHPITCRPHLSSNRSGRPEESWLVCVATAPLLSTRHIVGLGGVLAAAAHCYGAAVAHGVSSSCDVHVLVVFMCCSLCLLAAAAHRYGAAVAHGVSSATALVMFIRVLFCVAPLVVRLLL